MRKAALQIGQKNFLWLKIKILNKVKNTVSCTYVISDLKAEESVGTFYEKELQINNKEEFRIEKSNQEKKW